MKNLAKKVLAAVMCLMLLASAALAENLTYANEGGKYTLTYPEEMILLDRDNVSELMKSIANGDMGDVGIDAATIEQQIPSIEQMDMAMLLTADGMMNVNVVYQDVGMELDNDTFLSALGAAMLQQYQAQFENCTVQDEGSIYTAGENAFARQVIDVETVAPLRVVVLYAFRGTVMYVMTVTINTSVEGEQLEQLGQIADDVAASFTFVE